MKFRLVTGSLLVMIGLVAVSLVAAPVSADVICGDGCSTGVQTPAGTVFVSTSDTNVVTVALTPIAAAKTIVVGNPFAIPPNPILSGFTRTTIPAGAAGTVNVDTILVPLPPNIFPGFSVLSLVIVSIQAPTRMRVSTVGTTVTFTPIIPPNPV